ncbi:MAG TPA: hypothetical protein VGP01_02380, partial [Rhizomicrobium sp.]|nr:hypothetical protein [Rhizomicrobium sp.]
MRHKTHWLWGGLALCLLATPLAADERDYFYVPRIPADSRMIVGPKCLAMQDLVGFAQCEPTS